MFIHSEVLNPCKCGSRKKPDLDSDDKDQKRFEFQRVLGI